MKRFLILITLCAALLFVGACDEESCSDCGYTPGDHISGSYTNTQGQTVYYSAYANADGCVVLSGCHTLDVAP